MQGLSDAVMHGDEAALIDVIGDWEVASTLQLVEGAFMPVGSLFVCQRFTPTCHVYVAADDVHGVAATAT